MKLEVGMYVRTKNGTIDRIVEDENGVCSCPTSNAICCEKHILATFIITKASHNIIDLIEVGDYVNGSKVSIVESEFIYWETGNAIHHKYIENIVTKEMFSSMSYKVGE